jgi:hypothetical protein
MANEIQKYTFSAVPSAGSWKPVYEGSPGSAVAWDAAASTALDASLDALIGPNSDSSGDYTSGLTVEFNGSLANTNVSTLSYQDNTLTIAGSATFGTTQEGGGGSNEIQTIVIDATAGTYTILISGYGTTATLNWNDDAAAIANAITNTIGGGATVNGSGTFPNYSFEFAGGVADTNINQMSFGTNSLTKTVTISVSVMQEGSPLSGVAKNMLLLGVG